jgi:hypothetical protein
MDPSLLFLPKGGRDKIKIKGVCRREYRMEGYSSKAT